VVEITGGRIVAAAAEATGNQSETQRQVVGAGIDTRSLRRGELFFALVGERVDGHQYLAAALQRGAVAAVVAAEAYGGGLDVPAGLPLVVVEDPLQALWALAAEVRSARADLEVAAVTGSNGKTTTKEMLAAILAVALGPKHVLKSIKSYNNHLGVPLTLLALRAEHRALVTEIGMNAPGEITALAGLARPRIGVITGVGVAHLQGVGSLHGVAQAKSELFAALPCDGWAVFPELEPPLAAVLEAAARHIDPDHRLRFGYGADAAVRVVSARPDERGRLQLKLAFGERMVEIALPIVGTHNAVNAAAAAAAAYAMGIEPEAVSEGLAAFTPPPHRCVVKHWKGAVILDDCYNANPSSMQVALDTLETLPGGSHLGAVVGDMRELGRDSQQHHQDLGRDLVQRGFEAVVFVGPAMRDAADAARRAGMPAQRAVWVETASEVVEPAAALFGLNWRLLFKASRAVKLERALGLLGVEPVGEA
jgi:UDP-N-acetylmuramoyl-tripeptide--D-alanyl-D-alanine ligase